jgi:Ca2+-binding EF-hand superfamily protein
LKKLYSLFDTDKNGILDLTEIISALSILCKGTIEAKLNALKILFDEDNKGLTFP